MIADSIHSFSDSVSTIAVMVGLEISSLPPDADHHYGHARAETVAAKLVALLLIFTAAGVGASSIRQITAAEIIVALMVMRTGLVLYWKFVEELVDTAPNQGLLDQM